MLQDPVKAVDGAVEEIDAKAAEKYVDMVLHAEHFLIAAGKAPGEARRIVLAAEPFAQFRDLLCQLLERRKTRT